MALSTDITYELNDLLALAYFCSIRLSNTVKNWNQIAAPSSNLHLGKDKIVENFLISLTQLLNHDLSTVCNAKTSISTLTYRHNNHYLHIYQWQMQTSYDILLLFTDIYFTAFLYKIVVSQ